MSPSCTGCVNAQISRDPADAGPTSTGFVLTFTSRQGFRSLSGSRGYWVNSTHSSSRMLCLISRYAEKPMKWFRSYIEKFRGGKLTPPRAPNYEVVWSAIGAFLGIFAVYEVGHFQQFDIDDSLFLVGSFGASAILIYGVPKSPYAQPRNLVLGHTLSAAVGVACALLLGDFPAIAAALAVSLALTLMHLTRSIHPPGGATALIAVIGSDQIHQMSFWYVLSPIFSGAVIMLIVALLVNNLSPHRRYPEFW
jgi:CBS-domain-containing membrane protein